MDGSVLPVGHSSNTHYDHDAGFVPVQPYIYRPLPNVHSTFRILILDSGEGDDPLKGKLVVADTTFSESYETISYVWGEPKRCSEITIRDEIGSGILGTTSSLHSALQRLRHPDRQRRLWADQVSINQDDKNERSQQVQLMARIYKNAAHVLVWLGPDPQGVAESAFKLIRDLDRIFQDEIEAKKFHIDHTEAFERQSRDKWAALDHLTALPWFTRCWIVQEIGFQAPATLFWGNVEFDWTALHRVCEELSRYQYLRSKFNIRTADIKYTYQRFIEPALSSYHANRFSFIYELHRARGQNVTDPRDRVFAFLGHYSVRASNTRLAAIKADYNKTITQVYIDVALRTLYDLSEKDEQNASAGRHYHNSALITLSAVQHMTLSSSKDTENQNDNLYPVLGDDHLPSWVPDWRSNLCFVLSEPIHPSRAEGATSPKLTIDEENLILSIHGVRIDTIKHCSQTLKAREFQQTSSSSGQVELPIQSLWHNICNQGRFDLTERYRNSDSALFAYMQTLSNGCIQNTQREGSRPYREIPKSTWLAHQAAYLVQTLGQSNEITPELHDIAKTAEAKEGYMKWNRVANAASTNRLFATTANGYYVLGPKVMEMGDLVCVFFGGKMPFIVRPRGRLFLLVGECYVHGLMNGEAIDSLERGEVSEEIFDIV